MEKTKRSLKEWIIRAVILMIGLTIAHFGVTLFLLSDLGAEPLRMNADWLPEYFSQ